MNYSEHYNRLIDRAKVRTILPDTYIEIHHIVPKCMGGNDDSDNLVKLLPEEHFVAHQLLVKIYPTNPKLVFAAKMMSVNNSTQCRNNKLYKWIRLRLSSVMSAMVRTEEHKKNISLSMIGKSYTKGIPKTDLHKLNMSIAKKNKPKNKEHRNKLSSILMELPPLECPHCGIKGKNGPMRRWHFDNCKNYS